MKAGRVQAKDVDAAALLAHVERLRWTDYNHGAPRIDPARPRWVNVQELCEAMGVPWKIMLAKLRAMKRQGELTGCFCGCRGDIELPDHDSFPQTPREPDPGAIVFTVRLGTYELSPRSVVSIRFADDQHKDPS